jgi:hypothetical protein
LHKLTPQQIKWRRVKQSQLKEAFAQEYPEDEVSAFLLSGGNVFNIPFSALYQSEDTGAIKGHHYVAGIDWGQAHDYTAISVFDTTEYREVELVKLRQMSFHAMIEEIVRLCHKWRIVKLKAERNSLGAPLIEMLNATLSTVQYKDGGYPVIEHFNTTSMSKHSAVQSFKLGLEEGLRLLNDPSALEELRSYTQRQSDSGVWQYSAPEGDDKHDDTVIARLLAHLATLGLR